jgi:TRAP-type mannitol/chloroaromatic compound transport system permease small subunit
MTTASTERSHPAAEPSTLERRMFMVTGTIDAISRWSGYLVAWLAIPLVFNLVYEVVSRYAFGAPTAWAYDLSYMLYGSFFMLGSGYTLLHGGHIRTDFIYRLWPARWQGVIDASLYIVLFFPAMILFFIAGWEYAGRSWAILERGYLSPWQPPIYPFKTVIPVTIALLLLQGISELLKSLYAAVKGRWP